MKVGKVVRRAVRGLRACFRKEPESTIRPVTGRRDLCTLCERVIPEDDEEHFFSGYTICARCAREKIGA